MKQLIEGNRKPAGRFTIELEGNPPRVAPAGRIVRKPPGGVRVAQRDQVPPGSRQVLQRASTPTRRQRSTSATPTRC